MTAASIARGVPITGFTGINGAGKTLLAVHCAILDMIAGRPVYSTVPVRYTDPKTGVLYESRPITSLRQLLTLEDATILLDDVSVIFSSRQTGSLPAPIVTLLQTVRHRRLTVFWTAPGWMRADVLLRSVTQALVSVRPWLQFAQKDTPWPQPRLVAAGLLDTTTDKIDAAPTRVLRRRIYRPGKLLSWGSYDTHADTPLLGHAHLTGSCVDCGGGIERPKHTQKRHEELGIPWFADDGLMLRPRDPAPVDKDLDETPGFAAEPRTEPGTPIASGIPQ